MKNLRPQCNVLRFLAALGMTARPTRILHHAADPATRRTVPSHVILNGAQRSEESKMAAPLRFLAALGMTARPARILHHAWHQGGGRWAHNLLYSAFSGR